MQERFLSDRTPQTMQAAITTIAGRSLIAIASRVVRAEKNVLSLPDSLSPGGAIRSGYKTS